MQYTSRQHHAPSVLVLDGPGLRLEELLPQLRSLGYACTYLPGAASLAGLEISPELILLDGALEGGPAGPAYGSIQARFADVPVVVLAHTRSLPAALEWFRCGAADYVPAPVDMNELHDRLQSALRLPVDTFVETCVVRDASAQSAAAGLQADDLPCGLLRFDDQGRLLEANRAALSLFDQPSVARLAQWLALPPSTVTDGQGKPLSAERWPHRLALSRRCRMSGLLRLAQRQDLILQMDALPQLRNGAPACVLVTIVEVHSSCDQ